MNKRKGNNFTSLLIKVVVYDNGAIVGRGTVTCGPYEQDIPMLYDLAGNPLAEGFYELHYSSQSERLVLWNRTIQ